MPGARTAADRADVATGRRPLPGTIGRDVVDWRSRAPARTTHVLAVCLGALALAAPAAWAVGYR